jgi:hypothetical protein
MSRTASILAVKPSLLDEMWRRRPLDKVQRQYTQGRLQAYCQLLTVAGADEGGPLEEGAREVSPAEARAIFEALCEAIADGVWDVPGWALRPFLDVAAILAHGRTPYPAGFEPDGFSTPELYVWVDGRDDAAIDAARKRVEQAEGKTRAGEDADLAHDVCDTVGALLERAKAEGLLVLIEHPHGL